MAIFHFAFSRFRTEISATEKAKAIADAQEIVAGMSVPGMRRIVVGAPLDATRSQGYEFALTAEFEDVNGFKAYLPNPEHVRLMNLMKNYTDGKSLLTYQIDTTRTAKL